MNCYLDIEVGPTTHRRRLGLHLRLRPRFDDLHVPIKDQGIVKSPVRIGPDCWLGMKVTVLRGAMVGHGSRARGARGRARRDPAAQRRRWCARADPAEPRRDLRRRGGDRIAIADIARKTQAAAREDHEVSAEVARFSDESSAQIVITGASDRELTRRPDARTAGRSGRTARVRRRRPRARWRGRAGRRRRDGRGPDRARTRRLSPCSP